MPTPSSNFELDAFPSVGEPASRRARRRRTRRLAAIGVIAVVLAGGTLAVRRASGSDNAGYRVATVGTHDVDAVLAGVATIEPVSQATVAFPVAGTVASVGVQPGETVTAGQQLAALDTNDLSQTLRQKQEALAQAQLVLSKALDGEDVSSLTGSGATARAASFSSGGDASDARARFELLSARVEPAAVTPTVDDGDITAAQQAVLAGQQQVDAAQTAAATALQSAQTVCASVGTDPTPTDGSGDASSSSITACQQALDGVLKAQQAVSDAQSALSTAMDDLDQLLQQLASENPGGGTATTPPTTSPSNPSAPTTTSPSRPDRGSTPTTTPSSEPPTSTSGGGRGTGGSRSGGGFGTGGGGGTGSSGSTSSSRSPSAADLVAYQAAVDAAAAEVTAAEQAIAQATIVSPIAGTVVAVDLAVGDDVTAGSSTQHVVVKGAGGFEATTTVSIDDVRDVKVGQAATVAPDGSTATFPAKVVSIASAPATSSSSSSAAGSSGTTVYQVVLALSGDTSTLGNGSIGSVAIVTDSSRSALAVPTSAITTTGNAHTVTVLENGKPTTAVVRTGAVGSTWTEVVGGLQAGQQVVLADLGAPLPSSATDTSRTSTGLNGRNGTIQIGNRTIQFGNGGVRVEQRGNG